MSTLKISKVPKPKEIKIEKIVLPKPLMLCIEKSGKKHQYHEPQFYVTIGKWFCRNCGNETTRDGKNL